MQARFTTPIRPWPSRMASAVGVGPSEHSSFRRRGHLADTSSNEHFAVGIPFFREGPARRFLFHTTMPINLNPRRRSYSSTSGFGLVELVVVLVIVTTLAGVAVPRYQNSLMRYRVDRTAARLVADLALLRAETRSIGNSRTMIFNVRTDQYGVEKFNALDSSSEVYVVNLSASPFHVNLVSVDFGGHTNVTFNGYGIPDSGGTVVLQAGTIQKTVTLDPNTAKATVQ